MPVCLTVSGESITVPQGVDTLEALLTHLGHDPAQSLAMAHQGVVIPRCAWSKTPLASGDTVEIVRPVFGG
ncbi:MAG: sulfur carrier protein ThiS [Alphaproteobacteria bacterium]